MMRRWLCVWVAGVLVLGACGGGGNKDAASSTTTGSTAESSGSSDAIADVKITRFGMESGYLLAETGEMAFVVYYTVTNSGSKAADYFAQIKFYDAQGNALGSTGITVDELGPGMTTPEHDSAPLPVEIRNGPYDQIATAKVTKVERTEKP